MPRFIEAITLGEIAVFSTLVVSVWALARRIIPAVRKASRLIDDVIGVPESMPGRKDGQPGIMDRLAAVETDLAQVRDTTAATVVQVHPNGGGSMRDQVDQLKVLVNKLTELVENRLPEEKP
jgi:hypothetical protein